MYPALVGRGHPEDRYLFEFDRDEKGRTRFDTDGVSVKFTDRAKAAQEAKWRRLSTIFGPRKALKKSMAACMGGNPPRLAYGWVYNQQFLWDYATFHNLEFDVTKYDWLVELAGTTSLRYGELTAEQQSKEELMKTLEAMVRLLVWEDLSEKAGVELERVVPFSYDWRSMFALFNNYNVGERHAEMEEVGGAPHVVEIIQNALTFGDYKPEPLWWYDWEHLSVDLSTPL